jgi:mannose-1-phosphate guanylyltransferase
VVEGIVLVGGQGTRLRPLTEHTAKPMLPVAGVPLIAHQLARLRDIGVRRVVLATSFRAETFAEYFGDGRRHGLAVEYAVELEPMGTGGGIREAAAALHCGPDEAVVVLNGDVLSGHDLAAQLARHSASGADVTLHLTRVEDARAFGSVPTDRDGRVTAFLEKSPEPVTDQVNAGCYVFRRALIDEIPAGRPVSVERETFPALLARGATVIGHVDVAYWLDLGTPAAYVRGSADLVLGTLGSSALPGPTGPALLLPGARVDPTAVVGGGTVVGAGAEIGPHATVDGSVLRDGARVGAGSTVRSCALGLRAVVGRGALLECVSLGDEVHVADGAQPEVGALIG